MRDGVVEARFPEGVVFCPHPLEVEVHRHELKTGVTLLDTLAQTQACVREQQGKCEILIPSSRSHILQNVLAATFPGV